MSWSTFIALLPQASELKAMNTNHSNVVTAHQSCHCHSYSQGGRDNQTVDIYSLAHRVNRNQVAISLPLLWKDADPTLPCNSHSARPSVPSAVPPQGRESYPTAPLNSCSPLNSCNFWRYPFPLLFNSTLARKITPVCRKHSNKSIPP